MKPSTFFCFILLGLFFADIIAEERKIQINKKRSADAAVEGKSQAGSDGKIQINAKNSKRREVEGSSDQSKVIEEDVKVIGDLQQGGAGRASFRNCVIELNGLMTLFPPRRKEDFFVDILSFPTDDALSERRLSRRMFICFLRVDYQD